MNIKRFRELFETIRFSKGSFPGTSCLLTGSAARQELRVVQNVVQSDIDLLLVVHDEPRALAVRGDLTNLLTRLSQEFTIDVACTLTLRGHITRRSNAGFIRSAAATSPIWDDIAISELLKTVNLQPPTQSSAALAQPVSYYCAKARNSREVSDWEKARLACFKLARLVNISPEVHVHTANETDLEQITTRQALALLAACTELWPSSEYFLSAVRSVDATELHRGVRDRVFLENHGLNFQTAFVRG